MTAIGVERTLRSPAEVETLRALREGDEHAFRALVDAYYPSLLRVALGYVGSRAVAEEVVQETWLGVLRGLDRFEGRSTLKTWIFRILANVASTRAVREARTLPFSALDGVDVDEAAVDADRFLGADDSRWPHHWASAPRRLADLPEQRLLATETRAVLSDALAELPPMQRRVVGLRDVEGWSSEEVCELLGLSEVNQRVLLHRGRSRLRAALEHHLHAEPA
jgi:RNA polymerase sigma-70 factor (ECF subfamily)